MQFAYDWPQHLNHGVNVIYDIFTFNTYMIREKKREILTQVDNRVFIELLNSWFGSLI